MGKKAIIITNNKIVNDKFCEKNYKVIYIDGSLLDVFITTRDYVHKGYLLLTHPLSGSIKPNETPYKTIAISTEKGEGVDYDSLMLIENSIETATKLLVHTQKKQWGEGVLDDFRVIDFDLISNAIL